MLGVLRHLRARARDERGFGMIELIAATTVMIVGLLAVFTLFETGIVHVRRAATVTTAAAIADSEMEKFRAIKFEAIGLDDADVAAAGAIYKGDPAYKADTSPTTTLSGAIDSSQLTIPVSSATAFPGKAPYLIQINDERILVSGGAGTTTWTVRVVGERGYDRTVAASHASGSTVTLRKRVQVPKCGADPCTNALPTKTVTGADGRPYRVDTYITWTTAANSEATNPAMGRLFKLVTIVVRDSTTPTRRWARLASSFDLSTGS